jgi:hypothetical protein
MEVWTVWREECVGEVPIFKGVFTSLEKARDWAAHQEGAVWGYILAQCETLDSPTAPEAPWRPIELRKFHTESKPRVLLTKLRAVDYEPLMPAPSVGDDFNPPTNPTSADLWNSRLYVMSSYRGYNLYLENGALVYRSDPKSVGGNGMVSIPDPTKGLCAAETCYVRYKGESWLATLNFV